MKSINIFFNELKHHGGAIWLENGSIQLAAPEKFQSQENDDFIIGNKTTLTSILQENQIFSFEKFLGTTIFKNSTSAYYPLSPAQERLWFIEQYEGGTNAYHVPEVYELITNTDTDGIKFALQQIVARHEILRSTIEQGDYGEPGIQIVHDAPLVIEQMVVKDNEDYEQRIKEDINLPFDLKSGYPIRVKLYYVEGFGEDTEHQLSKTFLLINIHHIASDGWSKDIFHRELAGYYEAFIAGNKSFSIPPLEIQYKDYAAWQRAYLTGEVLESQLNYWKDKLSGFQALELPADYPRPPRVDYRGANVAFRLGSEISRELRGLARRLGVTLNSVLLGGINILLSKYSGQEDIVIGIPIANRQHRQTEGLIGFFLNTLVSRTRLSSTQSFEELIVQVHEDQVQAQLHQDLPFEKLVSALGVDMDTSRHPVFQVMFIIERSGSVGNLPGLQNPYIKPYKLANFYEAEKFDISIHIDDSDEQIKGQVSYAASLFKKDSITRITGYFTNLLEQLIKAPKKPYGQVSLLSRDEYNQIICQWNTAAKCYPNDKTLHQLFEEQAERTPDTIALVYEGTQLTFKDLNEKSNQLARYIREQYRQRNQHGFAADTLVALFLERSPEMVTGILAVLKAGGGYVPIDTSYPQERIDYLLSDCGALLILSQSHMEEKSNRCLPKDKVINIDQAQYLCKAEDGINLLQAGNATNLAYVIYTSGTTGKPNGVLIEHVSVVNLVTDLQSRYNILPGEVFLLSANYVFDASVEQMWLSLLSGGTLCVIDSESMLDGNRFAKYVADNHITHVHSTPSFLSSVDPTKLPGVKRVVFGAEYLPKQLFDQYKAVIPVVINEYGPTETTITSLTSVNSHLLSKATIRNVSAYVLDHNKNPSPVGVKGELYIGGAGLARGYLNQPGLTKERFISNPFASIADKTFGYTRLYKTGDLVRWLPDGNLEFIGRNDDQVKIRGFRMEPGEIEHAFSLINGIKQSCVSVIERKTGSGSYKYLAGYYVSDNSITQSDIMGQLSLALPEYMLPGVLVPMESFPLTVNGKLDKKALPDPDLIFSETEFTPPVTEIENAVCRIWQAVLGLDKVGITDDFFRIGGSSILAIQVSHSMSKAIGIDVKVADVFKYKCIANILPNLIGQRQITIPRGDERSSVLSFAQERLWFIEQYERGTNAYHMPEVYELDAAGVAGIKFALRQIVARHEVLRSTIEQADGGYGRQHVHEECLPIEEITLPGIEDFKSILKEDINRPFDLASSYPIRVKFYSLLPGKAGACSRTFLLINFHHIASDGWSVDIFGRELFAYYSAFINGDDNFRLPALEIQYKDYAVWQRKYLTGEVLEHQLSYWKKKISGYQRLELPTDYPRPAKTDYGGASHAYVLNDNTSRKLRSLARQWGVTMHSLMLSSINILLSKYTGQEDIVIGSPIANRHYKQTEGLIGFFVNSVVNRTILDKSQSFEELVKQVHRDQIQLQSYQDMPFEKLVAELGEERDVTRHPVFQVSFVVQSFGNENKASDLQRSYLRPFQKEDIFETTRYDLTFYIDDSDECIKGLINYATSLFSSGTICRLTDHYINLLTKLAASPKSAYSQISVLSQQEYEQITHQWNETARIYPQDKTIVDLFEEQVRKNPGNTAVVFENRKLSYGELNELGNRLAAYLKQNYDIEPDDLVAIKLERSEWMIVAIIGVLKSGGAYVPIDPEYPQDRIDFIVNDSGCKALLNESELEYFKMIKDFYSPDEMRVELAPRNLVYCIYTSGTTGMPKGVLIEHRGLVNLAVSQINEYAITDDERILQLSSISFDASVEQICMALLSGAALVIAGKDVITDKMLLERFIVNEKISYLQSVPSLLSILEIHDFSYLKRVISAGEQCNPDIPNKWKENCKFYNVYGPTEATISSSVMLVASEQDYNNLIPIGKPISNVNICILDSNCDLAPIGIKGELCIGGIGLARGYLNRPELTAERFIEHPYRPGERIYRTGDLARWLPNGNLEYFGRFDDQVKILGHRIELGEIEHALTGLEGIKQSCVVAKERKTETGTSKYLVGYYVLDRDYVSSKSSEILNNWEQLYDDEYERMIIGDIEPDFTGWNSYITNQPIPLAEMEAWRDGILGIIKSLNPGNVLEIGVGSGLIMYPLLEDVRRYVGLDISQSVINRHKTQLRGKNFSTGFHHLKADQVDQLPEEDLFDTVIINSVSQYFPGISYFTEVLEKALDKLSENGSIFIGDIRNYDFHKDLIKEKFVFEGKVINQHELDKLALKESELLISPGYFDDLAISNPDLDIEVLERKNGYVNELSKYRYDVVISVKDRQQVKNVRSKVKRSPLSKVSRTSHCNIPSLNQLSKEKIFSQLSGVLPPYMLPGALILMESLPLTFNGKLDKRSLPDPDFGLSSEEYISPSNESEAEICKIWQSVLGMEQVGVTDDFFRIGGNSILAIQISHRMSKEFKCDVKVGDLFKFKDIRSLSENLVSKNVNVKKIMFDF